MGKHSLRDVLAPLAVGALLLAPAARAADESPTAEPSEARAELDVSDLGLLVGGMVGRSPSGRTVFSEAGARGLGLRSLGDRAWLGLWDARLTATTGTAAQASPPPLMVGWRARAEGELGRRFRPAVAWSPYLGARGLLRLQWLKSTTGGPRSPNQMPSMRGLTGAGALRLGTGVSYLQANRSLLLLAFLQAARRPTQAVPEESFADLGLAARLDLADHLSAALEASRGWSGLRRDHALGTTERTTHEEIDAAIRIGLWRVWIQAEARVARDADRLVYHGGRTYRTVSGPDREAGLAVGAWLWR